MASPFTFLHHYYLRRYALRFRHARKLFFFDLALLTSTLLFAAAALGYYLYTPPVSPRAIVVMYLPEGRVKTGDTLTLRADIIRPSDIENLHAEARVEWPKGFSPTHITVSEKEYATGTVHFPLDFTNTTTFSLVVDGVYISQLGEEAVFAVHIYEENTHLFLGANHATILGRDSVIGGHLSLPEQVVRNGQGSFRFSLRHEGGVNGYTVFVPLAPPRGVTFHDLRADLGTITPLGWRIESLLPGQVAELEGWMSTQFRTSDRAYRIQFTPEIISDGVSLPQLPIASSGVVSQAAIEIRGQWNGAITSTAPGEKIPLTVTIKNTEDGAVRASAVDVLFDEAVIDTAALLRTLTKSTRISGGVRVPLGDVSLRKGEEVVQNMSLPVRTDATSEVVRVRVVGQARLGDTVSELRGEAELPQLMLGTRIALDAEVRYFTSEGDQLGRGALPPRVNATTKYWVIITLKNGRGLAEKPILSVSLPRAVMLTGQTSVTRGDTPVFDEAKKKITWYGRTLQPFQTVEVAFEIVFTPTSDMAGTIVTLVDSVQGEAFDPITNRMLREQITKGLSTALPHDLQGRAAGTAVLPE